MIIVKTLIVIITIIIIVVAIITTITMIIMCKTSVKVIPIMIGAFGVKFRITDWMVLLEMDD